MNSISLSSVERKPITEIVAESILSLIRDGQLRPGDKLPSQKDLVQMLKVSQPTLREALTGLTMLGYIESRAGQGYFVREMGSEEILDFSVVSALVSDETISQLYEARALVETFLTHLAIYRADDEDIARLRACVKTMEDAIADGDATFMSGGGLDFHQLIADATHNVFLSQMESTLLGFFREHLARIYTSPPTYEKDVEPHRRILEHIESRNIEGATRWAYDHIRDFTEKIGMQIPWIPRPSAAPTSGIRGAIDPD
jgi:GntR family transcriptional repressor for pyruvate dehydrogenase complex